MMESVLLSCWLVDAEKAPEMRVARALSLLPSVYQGAIDTLQKFPSQGEELARKQQASSELIALYRKNRVEVVRKVKGGQVTDLATSVVFRDNKAAFSRNITQLAQAYLPDSPWLYPLLSGAAHSESWLLSGINTGTLEQSLNSIFMPLLAFGEAYARALCSYFGMDARPHLAANERRLKAMVLRAGTPASSAADKPTAFGDLGSGFIEEFVSQRQR
ncbi:hypothetical protein EBM89_18580 [Cellulomonas triticagri]|uniref:Uncharacterized protein n=1 Tax=Cellulomonas triticagri TaxID=2483352 RepID=A0A3M2IV26_9CELL|nr:hypothetical protein EBM89_18580 [Cellulomonas triticagri]